MIAVRAVPCPVGRVQDRVCKFEAIRTALGYGITGTWRQQATLEQISAEAGPQADAPSPLVHCIVCMDQAASCCFYHHHDG
jgi:hypothetical protein